MTKDELKAHFADIVYNDELHSYTIGNLPLTSVSMIAGLSKRPFDKFEVSRIIAMRDNSTQKEVLESWEKKGQVAINKGNLLHAYAEDVMMGKNDPLLKHCELHVPEAGGFANAWRTLQQKHKASLIATEVIVGDAEFGMAGRFDALISLDGQPFIFDWKTGKFETSSPFSRMLPPFEDLDDCKYTQYSIQVNLYRILLEKHGFQLAGGYLVHLRGDGTFIFYPALDLRERILQQLAIKHWWYDEQQEKIAHAVVQAFSKINPQRLLKDTQKALLGSINKLNKRLLGEESGDED